MVSMQNSPAYADILQNGSGLWYTALGEGSGFSFAKAALSLFEIHYLLLCHTLSLQADLPNAPLLSSCTIFCTVALLIIVLAYGPGPFSLVTSLLWAFVHSFPSSFDCATEDLACLFLVGLVVTSIAHFSPHYSTITGSRLCLKELIQNHPLITCFFLLQRGHTY